jgi:hypothetical protein
MPQRRDAVAPSLDLPLGCDPAAAPLHLSDCQFLGHHRGPRSTLGTTQIKIFGRVM